MPPRTGNLGGLIVRWEPALEQVVQDLAHLELSLAQSALVLESSEKVIREDIRERFDVTKEDPHGDPWQEWSEKYRPIAEKVNKNGILVRKGPLRDAAVSEAPFMITGNFLTYDTGELPVYAAAHQFGMTVGKGAKLPVREFLGISADAYARIVGIYNGFVEGNISLFHDRYGKIRTQTRSSGGRFGAAPVF